MTTRVESAGVDVYPVGWLAELGRAWRRLHIPGHRRGWWWGLHWELGYTARRARSRDWRAVRNTFNGYLAEPHDWPQDGSLRRCGSGWTRGRALRSLRRHGWRH